MTIYLDIIFLINLAFDFLILLLVDIVLKRRTKIYRLILGSLFGAFSIFLLFINISSLTLFFLKIIISIVMLIITFPIINFKNFGINILFLYTASFLLGGFIYFLNNNFSYKQEGMVFFYQGISINSLFLLITLPAAIYFYIKQFKIQKKDMQNIYKVDITFNNNETLRTNAYLDTGNKLIDPITKKKIVLIDKSMINSKYIIYPLLIPYNSLNHNSLLTCIKIKEINVCGIGKTKNVLLGLSEQKFNIAGSNVILNNELMEDLK